MNPTTPSDELFTRAEVQRGLPEKRASMLLFLIEGEVMQHVVRFQAMLSMAGPMPETGAWPTYFMADDALNTPTAASMHDPITAIKLARQGRAQPTIWEIERFAEEWKAGVPPTANLRAATARLMAQKYHFTAAMAPGIRAALGLDTAEVRSAFQAIYNASLESIYAPEITWGDRLADFRARLENALVSIGNTLRGARR